MSNFNLGPVYVSKPDGTAIVLSNIFKVCNGERNTAGGYKWRYKDD